MGYYFHKNGAQKPTIGAIVDVLKRYPRNWPVEVEDSSDFGIAIFVEDGTVSFFDL